MLVLQVKVKVKVKVKVRMPALYHIRFRARFVKRLGSWFIETFCYE